MQDFFITRSTLKGYCLLLKIQINFNHSRVIKNIHLLGQLISLNVDLFIKKLVFVSRKIMLKNKVVKFDSFRKNAL